MIIKEIASNVCAEVPIVDNEISNDISNNGGMWNYEAGKIISCCILYGNKITIIAKEKKDDELTYKKVLTETLDKLPTMYAFNFNMEKGNFKGFLGRGYWVEEIKPFKGKGWSKQKFFEELVREKRIKAKDIPNDPIEDDSSKVLPLYEKEDYETIINHNISDVIKQYHIWKNKHYFLDKYGNKINSQGWYNE